jgi:hypothetical protein
MENGKSIYICGPLTELPKDKQAQIKEFYSNVAATCEKVTGKRGFLPHEHGDPVLHANLTPAQIDAMDRAQVCQKTSLLLVVAVATSWGGGIEVEMANQHNIPAILLCPQEKLQQRTISRLLRGNPAIRTILAYKDEGDALQKLEQELQTNFT